MTHSPVGVSGKSLEMVRGMRVRAERSSSKYLQSSDGLVEDRQLHCQIVCTSRFVDGEGQARDTIKRL